MASKRSKFVIAELFSNSNGKTSASGFVGILVGIIGCLAFATAVVGYILNLPNTINVMQQSTIFIGAATALLAARKFAPGANDPEMAEIVESSPNNIEPIVNDTIDNKEPTI